MKSLRRCTPEVRTSKSQGGASAVKVCSVMVSAVIFSGSGYAIVLSLGGVEAEVCEEGGRSSVEAMLKLESSVSSI